MTELYRGNEAMVTAAASDVGLLVAETACDKTVGTAYHLERYEEEVLKPLGLQSVSQPCCRQCPPGSQSPPNLA